MKRKRCLLCALVLCFCLYSCSDPLGVFRKDPVPDRESLPGSKREISGFTDPSETGETVYWTEGGTVYHKSRECTALRDAESINCGSVDRAQLAGKEKACRKCSESE